MKYAIKTRFIFEGTFFVGAENKSQAKEYVEKHCGLVLGGDIHSSLSCEDVDWDFLVHPEKVIAGGRRVS
ncbi:conserved hypothetical protein [Treponema primitia ZAS-2]|uniref:Uncharacterized protein n=1 Tax=Treponema primitia (strain ATCC BAA-887 / DSM 12427 / ZAS-2) TaxID=545694 RepID=F5YIA0_TREPZ|nr:hypothetical protein [Treponema primitia]AEF86961.1 conserved hypothetical protein [Treponema primitia ZAS-2]